MAERGEKKEAEHKTTTASNEVVFISTLRPSTQNSPFRLRKISGPPSGPWENCGDDLSGPPSGPMGKLVVHLVVLGGKLVVHLVVPGGKLVVH